MGVNIDPSILFKAVDYGVAGVAQPAFQALADAIGCGYRLRNTEKHLTQC